MKKIWISGLLGVILRNRTQKAQAASKNAPREIVMSPQPEPVMQRTERAAQTKTREITLSAVGYPGVVRRLSLPEGMEVTVGRNGKADKILDAEDKKLSGVHCSMRWENGKIYVRDLNSKNGTYVNGVPIQRMGRVAVDKGETIRIGSYEYRVG